MKPTKRAGYMWKRIGSAPSGLVSWYLMTSWLYYQHDISIIPDDDYNKLCLKLLADWDGIEHRHKFLLDRESLVAGTGYAITDYPSIATSAATRIAIEDKQLVWNKRIKRWVPRV